MLKNTFWTNRFMGSKSRYEAASIIMVGVPFDFTVSFRPGTRYGPQKVREVSYGLEEYSPYLDRELDEKNFFDYGDLDLPFGDVTTSFKMIKEAALEILQDNKKPIFIGGEHSISGPIIQSAYEIYGNDLIVLHFDAHADLRRDYMGVKESHASVIRRVTECIHPANIYQYGIRSGTREEFAFGKENTNFYPFKVYDPLMRTIGEFKKRPIYITLDIDVIDPAFACGTGTPEPGGCTVVEMLQAIAALKDQNVIGYDIVEVSPPYDPSDRTAILAAKLIREGILSFM